MESYVQLWVREKWDPKRNAIPGQKSPKYRLSWLRVGAVVRKISMFTVWERFTKSSTFRPGLSRGKKPQQKNHRENKPEREQGPEGMLEGGLKIVVRMLKGGLKVPMPPLHLWEVLKKKVEQQYKLLHVKRTRGRAEIRDGITACAIGNEVK